MAKSRRTKEHTRSAWEDRKGLDGHRRKVVLSMEQKSSFITSIQREEDSPDGRHITIQVYNTEKTLQKNVYKVQHKVQMNNQSQESSQTSSGTVFSAVFLPVMVSS